MREFKVNQYIQLKFDGKETQIFVNGEFFRLCKILSLAIPVEKISSLDEIESVDEVAEKLKRRYKTVPPTEAQIAEELQIPLEAMFWGHCSVRHEAVWLNAET